MDVHARDRRLHRTKNVAIIKRRQSARQPALDADFRGAEFPGLDGFLRDLLGIEKISVGLTRPAAEGAELAAHETYIGEIDVAIDHVRDDVSREFIAQKIGGDKQTEQVISVGICEK